MLVDFFEITNLIGISGNSMATMKLVEIKVSLMKLMRLTKVSSDFALKLVEIFDKKSI